jgi:hypothetical protein
MTFRLSGIGHRISIIRPRRALAATAVAGLVACSAGVLMTPPASAATPGTTVSAAGRARLTAAYAAFRHIPVSDVAGIQTGSIHAAMVSGREWATASFLPARKISLKVQVGFQDGGSIGVFTRRGHTAWTMRSVGGEPFPCGKVVSAAVRAAWGLKTPAACAPAARRAPRMTPQAETGTTASVATVALSQVGRGDTPASVDWSQDCNPYSALVGAGASTDGCGADPNFNVVDENELWCADFSKWVWEQAGVTTDLSTLNAGATSFAKWAQDQGESTAFDSGAPAVGDAIVFYQPGVPVAVGSTADHVGLIVGVDSSNGTVDIVNGDFMGSSNITVQDSGYVSVQSWADSIWLTSTQRADGEHEQWVLVSPKLPVGSTSPVSIDAAGTDVAFVNASGQVSHDWGTSSGWAGPAAIGGTARADSPVMENAAGTLVAFINTSGQVVNDWANSTGWHGPAAIGGTARAGSPLAMNAAGTDVSFVNASGQVSHDWGTSSGWAGPAAIGGTARADSPLVEDDNGDTVVFFNTSGQVVNDWATSSGWAGPAAIGGTAATGSPLATDDDGRDVVFVDSAGQVVNDWGTSSGWTGPAAVGGTARADSGMAQDGSGADVVFMDSAGNVVNDWGTSSGWNGPAAIGGTARAGSGIAESDDGQTVVFINPAGQVVNDWGTSTGWHGPAAIGGTSR